MKAVIYIRWSTGEQSQGDSERRQRSRCEAFIKAHGWTLVDTLIEDGNSAFRGANHAPGSVLGKLEARVDAGEFDEPIVIVADKLHRFSRQNARVTFRWIDRLAQKGLSFATQADGRVYNENNLDMVGMIILLVEADAAHQLSKNISDHISQSWLGKREGWQSGDGSPDTRIAPDWVSVVGAERVTVKDEDDRRKRRRIMQGGHYELNESVSVIRRIFAMAMDGMGINLIAKTLNLEGVPSPRGSIWMPANIGRLLKSRSVLGEYLPRTKGEDGSRPRAGDWLKLFPAAIDETTFYAVQAQITGRRHLAGRKRGANNLIQGLGHCERCGGRMTFQDGGARNKDKLRCRSNRFGLGCSADIRYAYEPLEKALLDLVLPLAMDPTFLVKGGTENSLDGEMLALEAKLENKRQAARALAETLEDTPSRTVAAKIAAMDSEIDEMELERDRLARTMAEVRGRVSNVEHLRKVAEVRAIATATDGEPAVRESARRRIQQAFADLIEDVRFFPNKRRIAVKFVGDARVVALDLEGRIGLDLDWMAGDHVSPDDAATPFGRATLRNYDRRRKAQQAAA